VWKYDGCHKIAAAVVFDTIIIHSRATSGSRRAPAMDGVCAGALRSSATTTVALGWRHRGAYPSQRVIFLPQCAGITCPVCFLSSTSPSPLPNVHVPTARAKDTSANESGANRPTQTRTEPCRAAVVVSAQTAEGVFASKSLSHRTSFVFSGGRQTDKFGEALSWASKHNRWGQRERENVLIFATWARVWMLCRR